MKNIRLFRIAALLAFAWLTALTATAQVQTTLAGVKFEPEATVAGQKLQLNGTGVRIRAVFRVYAAGLYTPGKVTKNEEVIKPGVKRLQLVALRDVKGDDFGKLFTRAIEDNSSKEVFSRLVPGVLRMATMFSDAKQFSKGDVIIVDYVPGTGLVTSFRGKQQGDPIKEPEFGENFFKIWFGPKPADDALRKALLGEQSTANTNIN